MLKHPSEQKVTRKELNQMMDLCVAWIGVLFKRLGVGQYRINTKDVSEGLGTLQFSAVREGDEYIITLTKREETEVTHVGDEA